MANSASLDKEGPYLTSAFICERLLQEADGTISAIRMIDQVRVSMVAIGPSGEPVAIDPGTMQAQLNYVALVSLKGGPVGSQHEVQLIGHPPTGGTHEFPPQQFTLQSNQAGGVPGQNLIIQLGLSLKSEGVYWFEVRMDGRWLTAIPLQVIFERPELSSASEPAQRQSPIQ